MKPSIACGIIFGFLTIIINIFLILPIKDKSAAMILISGLLFFNTLFSVLFTKKSNGYILTWIEGMKSAIQSGIIMGLFYFGSIVLIQKYISPGYFPELESLKQFFLIFNINIILFSIFSIIFGLITSSLFHNKK
jgi:hypothetical protein